MDDLKKGFTSFKKGTQKNMAVAKAKITGQPPPPDEEQGLIGDIKDASSDCFGMCKLTRKQRLYGFAYSIIIGAVLSGLGLMFFGMGNTIPFAVLYSLGTVMSLCSSLFLWGPCHQIKNMMKETRLITTIIMLLAIAFTLFAALYWGKKYIGLVLVSVVVQLLATTWYGLSYIPYARSFVTSCMKKTVGM